VTYRVGFGLEPMGVALVSGNYRFFFKVRDSVSVGSFTSGSRLVSERRTTRTYPTQYVIELQPPSFARLLSATNRQVAPASSNGTPGEAVYFSRDTLMDGPVFTNGQFNFTGNAWFADSVRSAGCVNGTIPVDAPCPGTTALYKDGNGLPLAVAATTDSDAAFTGYASGAAPNLTSPEFVRRNLNADGRTYTPGTRPNLWNYTGEYQAPTIELPTVATSQLEDATNRGLVIERTATPGTSLPRVRRFINDGGPTQLEVFATRTPQSASTSFAPINPGANATGTVYQFIRLKLRQKLSNCRAAPTNIVFNTDNIAVRPSEYQDYLVAVTGGQDDYSFEFAPTDRTATFARTDSTPVTGSLSNTTSTGTRFTVANTSPQSPGFTGTIPSGNPVNITATFAGGVTRVNRLYVKPGVPVAPSLSVSTTSHPFEGGNSTFTWPAPPAGVTYRLERSPSVAGDGYPLTVGTGTTATGATLRVERAISVPTTEAQTDANRADVSYTYRLRATNALGESALSPASPAVRVTVRGAVRPGVTLRSEPDTSPSNRLPVGGATVQLKWNLFNNNGTPFTNIAAFPFRYILFKPDGTQQDVTSIDGSVGFTTPVITNSATSTLYALKVIGPAGIRDLNNPTNTDAGDYEELFVNPLQPPVINTFTKSVGGSSTANLPFRGGVANLQWNITGFNTTVSINQGVGAQTGNGNSGNGVTTGSANAPTTDQQKVYTITATNAAGTDTKQVTVSVDPLQKPTISDLSLNPGAVNNVVEGPTFNLRWAVSSDAPATLSLRPISPSGAAIDVTDTTSRNNLPITENVTYELTATNSAGSSTRVIRVLITPPAPPIITSLIANPASYPTAQPGNMRPNISWAITLPTNGPLTALTLTPLVTSSNVINSSIGGSATARTGNKTIDTSMSNTTDFTLTATNAGGTTSRVVRVPVGSGVQALPPLPTIVRFTAVPIAPNTATTVGGGNNTISYETRNGTSWSLTQNRPLATALPQPSSNSLSSFVRLIPETTSYTLTVSNAAGSVSRTIQVAVPFPPPPVITAFASSPNPIPFPGGDHTFTYAIANATASSISNGVGSVQGLVNKRWTTTTNQVYTLTASNEAGTVTDSITVRIDPQQAPTITSFTPLSQSLPFGGGSGATLNWSVNTVSAGGPITTTITLESTTATGVAVGGSRTVTADTTTSTDILGSDIVNPTVSGTYTYRIDSKNNINQASAPKTVTVTVDPSSISIPTINASGTPFAFQNGGTTQSDITWTVSASPVPTSVTIARISPNPTSAVNASGSYPNYSSRQTVGATGTYTYRVTATNATGPTGTATRDVTVVVNPPAAPEITSFTATPNSLPASGTIGYAANNGNSTLAWAIPASSGPINSGSITRSGTPATAVTLSPGSNGSTTVSGLGTPGTYAYTLTATGVTGASPLTATRPASITVRPVATLQNLTGGSNADRPEEAPLTGSRAVNPGWTATPEWSTPNTDDHPVNGSRVYSVSVDPPNRAISNVRISSDRQVTYNVGQIPGGLSQEVYTITAKLVVNGNDAGAKTTSWTVVVSKNRDGASLRPRARLTQTSCSAGGPVEYYWPVFMDLHIRNTGTEQTPNMQISTRTYGASGNVADPANANWSGLPPTTPAPWTPEMSFNGVLYIDGQTVVTGPPRVAATRPAPNPQYFTQPAIASFAAMTFTSTAGMVIRNDITYQNPVCSIPPSRNATTGIVTPATCEQSQANWSRNVLGLYAPTGNIVIDSIAPNPTLHAITMASQGSIEVAGIREVTNTTPCPDGRNGARNLLIGANGAGNQLGLVNIQGSLIQDTYGQFGKITDGAVSCGYGRSMTFDRRMNDATYVPPSFPRANNQVWATRFFTFDNDTLSAPILVTPTSTLPVRPGFSRQK
jgi:hypothetical protein